MRGFDPSFFINKKKVLLTHMSGTFKFKRIYSEGVAAEHPDIAGQKEFANRADAEITRRRKERAKKGGPQLPGFVASVKKEEVELEEGMTMSDFKKQRSRQKQKEKRAADKIAPGRRTGIHKDSASPERAARHRANIDPDYEGNDEDMYPGGTLRPNKVRKAKAMKELDEKIDVGADAGATISDFVHSKSKTFKGDSKKQRIKRALGAYYGAQKEEKKFDEGYMPPTQKRADKMMKQSSKLHRTGSEIGDFGNPESEKKHTQASKIAFMSRRMSDKAKERDNEARKKEFKEQLELQLRAQKEETENIYDYVIETLVDSDFAQDYETAENMFECMSDEFVAVILEDYIEEKARGTRPKKTIHAYDVDETLFGHGKKGKPNVQVHVKDASGKRVQSLSNQEFNTHKLDKSKGHSYDFSEFQSAKTFSKTSTPNKKTIKDVKRKQARGQNVHIITARSKFDKPSEFQGHLKKHGIDVPMNKIHYTGGMKGSDVGKKKVDTAKGIAKQSGAKETHMYDDAAKVNNAFEKEKQNNPTSTKIKTHLAKPNASGETTLRSYQATKGGRTSDNPSSTTKQTQRRRKKARKNMGEEMTSYEYWKQFVD
jgi:hypothetical protein